MNRSMFVMHLKTLSKIQLKFESITVTLVFYGSLRVPVLPGKLEKPKKWAIF